MPRSFLLWARVNFTQKNSISAFLLPITKSHKQAPHILCIAKVQKHLFSQKFSNIQEFFHCKGSQKSIFTKILKATKILSIAKGHKNALSQKVSSTPNSINCKSS
jgi:hypothetical protein